MIRFNNDYNRGAHPAILEALASTNDESYGGYGIDPLCQAAAEEIKKYLDCPQADVHFLLGGTQANFTAISACLRPYQSVLSAHTGHIHVHETGAVEHIGHKIEVIPARGGKITAEQIRAEGERYRTSPVQEHITQPKLVYLAHPTEYGAVYSLKELADIRRACDAYGMYLFLDGARMGYGLGAEGADVTLADIARLTDMFYIGGTKCGALFGEALVITEPSLQPHFRSYIKQNGGMLAKGWLLGLQFYTLFKDGLYFDITRKAVAQAMTLKEAFAARGIPTYGDSPTNQQFVVVTYAQMAALGDKYVFEFDHEVDKDHVCIRFCTSWATTDEEIAALVEDIGRL